MTGVYSLPMLNGLVLLACHTCDYSRQLHKINHASLLALPPLNNPTRIVRSDHLP